VAGIAAWLSVMAGALFTSLQLWLSGTSQLQVVIPAMLFVHALIGLGEAVVTVAALSFVLQARPDLLGENSESAKGSKGWIIAGLAISLVVVLLSPLASTDPDGLNRVAEDLGFINAATTGTGPLAGYVVPFLANASVSKIAAGALGVLAVLGLTFFAGRTFLVNRKS
jgi:cobalt/nickel transport system permease protein